MSSTKRPASSTIASSPLKRTRPTMATNEVLPIRLDGDLLVRVGGQHPETARTARVNSALLKAVSPVFDVMLGPHFKEGQSTHDASSPLELPDDDPDAIIDLFYLIHYKSYEIKDAGLLELLIICDKYKCFQSFKEFWTYRLPKCQYSQAESLLVASITDDKRLFDGSSEIVLRMNRDSMIDSCHPMVLEAYGSIVEDMAAYRAKVREEYHRITCHFPIVVCSLVGKASCAKFNSNIGHLLAVLVRHGVLVQSFEDDSIDLPDASGLLGGMRLSRCNCSVCGGNLQLQQRTWDLAEKIQVGEKGECGLCFECFKSRSVCIQRDCNGHKE